jgi:hypothetical protein
MPISPVHLFIASNSERVFATMKSQAQDQLVVQCNNVVVQSASKYVWSLDNSQLRFVENRLTKERDTPFAFDPMLSTPTA